MTFDEWVILHRVDSLPDVHLIRNLVLSDTTSPHNWISSFVLDVLPKVDFGTKVGTVQVAAWLQG